MEVLNSPSEIYFDHFVKLCGIIGRTYTHNPKANPAKILENFITWCKSHPALAPGTGVALFRLLFPQEDFRRKYGLKEERLSKLLTQVLQNRGVGGLSTAVLRWSTSNVPTIVADQGCLGDRLRNILEERNHDAHTRGITPTIREVDSLLTELSQKCEYTQAIYSDNYGRSRPPIEILQELYGSLEANRSALITQIILKDLNPILYPIKDVNTTKNLLYNDPPTTELTLIQAMGLWDPRLPGIYRIYSSIEEAFEFLETRDIQSLAPKVGVPIMIPKCYKGRSCKDALQVLSSATRVYCETKYDGERMQIHVDLSLKPSQQITIFSKSKRDSTMDRFGTLGIIRSALGLPDMGLAPPGCHEESVGKDPPYFSHSLIIEAEMVAYSEKLRQIDEFWRIRSLISRTAKGCRKLKNDANQAKKSKNMIHVESDSSPERDRESQEINGHSLESDGSDGGDRHFMLVFFDILFIDGRNLLNEPYHIRRGILREVVHEITGYISLAERTPLDMNKGDPCRALQIVLSTSISQFEEGLVLKAENSKYNSFTLPWVKLKKDYIPGLGDCIDMVVIGAGWDKDRARELRVGMDTFTTFYVAALSNLAEGTNEPHFECLFVVSYGISRGELEQLNFVIKYHSPLAYKKNIRNLPYTFNLSPGLSPPSVVFRVPMLFELFGAGFDKPQMCKYYALRWPRVSKIYLKGERSWEEGETIETYTKKAYAVVGRDGSSKQASIAVASMWNVSPQTSPEARSIIRKKELQAKYLALLRRQPAVTPKKQGLSYETSDCQPRDDIKYSPLKLLAGKGLEERKVIPSIFPDALTLLNQHIAITEQDKGDPPRKKPRLETDGATSHKKLEWSLITTSLPEHVLPRPGPSESKSSRTGGCQLEDTDTSTINSKEVILSTFNAMRSTSNSRIGVDRAPLSISSTLLLEKTFSLIYRPLYPIPKRPRNKPAVKSVLPAARLVNTLDALLAAVGWAHRQTPVSSDVKCGVIFVEPFDIDRIVNNIEARRIDLGARLNDLPKIFIVLRASLDIYLESSEREMDLDVLWKSH